MFFSEPAADGPSIAVPSMGTVAVDRDRDAVTVVLGVFPQPVLELADKAAVRLFIR